MIPKCLGTLLYEYDANDLQIVYVVIIDANDLKIVGYVVIVGANDLQIVVCACNGVTEFQIVKLVIICIMPLMIL